MKPLTIRGSHLASQLKTQHEIIEVFPTATAKILGTYNKNYNKVAAKLDIKVKNKHHLDACLCSLTVEMHLQKKNKDHWRQ